MSKQRLNQDEVFKSIMGKTTEESETETPVNKISEKKAKTKEKLVPTAFYITEKQRKALKIKTALSDKPEDKDLSSIVRAALDIYLADILEDLK